MSMDQPTLTAAPNVRLRRGFRRIPLWARVFAIPLAVGFTGMSTLLLALRFAPLPDESLVSPAVLKASNDQTLAELTGKGTRYGNVPLSSIPIDLQEATIAVEDQNFYQHHAFSPLSLVRASLVNLLHHRVVEGGSTITQQLAKNLFLSQDRTFTRKFREALYATQLELQESKSTILNQYLNVVYYGHGAYGIGAASKLYFHKQVQDLTLAESALLAGLPKGPTLYSPIEHWDKAKARQKTVLTRMVKAGYITQAQADKAYAEPIHLTTVKDSVENAPYFTSVALREVEQQFHVSRDEMERGDVSITTTLDPLLQKVAERALATTLPKGSGIQAALVAMDPKTGEIKAMVGGRDYQTSPYNRVFAERQPGSTFKAILYTTALSEGWLPDRQVDSEETTFLYDQSKKYTVHDYDDYYAHRPLTLREALSKSDNVYAVTAGLEVGPEEVIKTAHKMGIHSDLAPYPSLALGVFPTSPLEMASAYAVLANGGFQIHPHAVSAVRDARLDKVLTAKVEKTQVVSPQVAFQMSDLLTSVIESPNGTAHQAAGYLHGRASAKTGTTKSDAWIVGYTPNLVTAVWVGYDDNRPLSSVESHLAAPIWAKFMGTAQEHIPAQWYSPPAGLVKVSIDPATAKLATDTCATTEADYFVKGTQPTEECPLHPATKKPAQQSWYERFVPKWF